MTPIPSIPTHVSTTTVATFALIAWLYYRRIRRHFGRQPYQPKRTVVRMVLVAIVALALLYGFYGLPQVRIDMAIGAAIGIAVGALGLRHTHAEWVDGAGAYTPNPWIGAGMSALLIGRLVWRGYSGAFANGAQQTFQNASPLTMGLFAMLIAYAIVYSYGLWWRMKQLAAAHAAPSSVAQ